MMKIITNLNKKKIIIIAVSAVLIVSLAGVGIRAAVSGGKKAVKVASVGNMNSGGWYSGSEVSDYGTVTTNMNQDIYNDDTLVITDIYVKAGDTVKIGDKLIAYDTSLASLEVEMKKMQIEGLALNIQNVQAELKQLRSLKGVSASGNKDDYTKKMKQMTVQKDSRPGLTFLTDGEEGTDPVDPEPENPAEPEVPVIGSEFPEELMGKTIYKAITIEAEPYNEDGEGTLEKPYRFLCAPEAAVNAEFMLKVLEQRIVCAFDVVDNAEKPTLLLYSWILDGKTGQIVKPDPPVEPEKPDPPVEPEKPIVPEEPSVPDNPVITEPAGPTAAELKKEIQEKEQQLKDLDLGKRTAELELKQLTKKVDDGVITSNVEGTVKTVNDEETARMENSPLISVVGEEGFYVTGRVAETALDKLEEGMSARVTSWETGMEYEATVSGISSSPTNWYMGGNENMSYYPFTVVIKGDADLSNGEGVQIMIDGMTSNMGDDIYLDQMFVREEGNQYYVYKKGENGRLTKQYVEVGKNMYGTLEILSGLNVDDEIAFPYGKDVKEGAKTETVDTLYNYY